MAPGVQPFTTRQGNVMPNIAPWAYVLAVPDFTRSAAYFRDVLGFRVLWEEAADWRLVERNSVRIMLGNCPAAPRPAEIGPHNWFAYVSVDDLDALHAELAARGADCSQPTNTSYGMREMIVTTLDGHRIVFGQDAPQPQGDTSTKDLIDRIA